MTQIPPILPPEMVQVAVALRQQGLGLREIGKRLRVSHTTIAKVMKAMNEPVPSPPPSPAPQVAPVVIAAPLPPSPPLPDVEALVASGDATEIEAELKRARQLAFEAHRARNMKDYNALARTIGILTAQLAKVRAAETKPADESPAMVRSAERARANLRRMLDEALGRRVVEVEPDV